MKGPFALESLGSTWRGLPRVITFRSPVEGARAKLLVCYLVLLVLSAVLATVAIREVLLIRLDDRIENHLRQEALELERLLANGRDPDSGRRFASAAALFDAYLARNVPDNEEGTLAFVDGRLHGSDLARFPLDRLAPETLGAWRALSRGGLEGQETASGTFGTRLGKAHFHAALLQLEEGGAGTFVTTILPAAELREIEELQTYGAAATLGVLLLASLCGWLIAGRLLAPMRLLTATARSISQSDLTRRVDVRGSDESAEMARSFNAMLDRLEGVFRGQREFLRDAGHELRDPLTIIRGHLELLASDPEERRATLGLVLDELDRMGRIVDDLHILAESEQPDFLRPEPIDLTLLAHELTAKASALGSRRWRLARTADGMFVADRHLLTGAVMNLAHNAVQHTTEDDALAIGAAMDNGDVCIWVQDSGCGISASDQARIFDRFQRGRGAHRRYRGGGLGLAIVRTVAEAHGGRVELRSREGTGSMFTIVLPRRPTTEAGFRWPGS